MFAGSAVSKALSPYPADESVVAGEHPDPALGRQTDDLGVRAPRWLVAEGGSTVGISPAIDLLFGVSRQIPGTGRSSRCSC